MKTNPTRELLGFTQEEMAHLMGVSRSYLALYELGKRNLPIGANSLVHEIVFHLSSAKKPAQDPEISSPLRGKLQRKLESLLRTNRHRQHKLTQKIAALEKREIDRRKRAQVVDFLILQNTKTGPPDKRYINFIGLKSSKSREEQDFAILFHSRLKQETLQQEEMLLQSRLEKLSAPDNGTAINT